MIIIHSISSMIVPEYSSALFKAEATLTRYKHNWFGLKYPRVIDFQAYSYYDPGACQWMFTEELTDKECNEFKIKAKLFSIAQRFAK